MAKQRRRKIDWCYNHQVIENFVVAHLRKSKTWPTREQIKAGTELSDKTVRDHMGELKIKSLMPQYKTLTPKVMIGLFAAASRGNPNAIKLWMQIVEDFSEKTRTEDETADKLSDRDIEKMAEELMKTRAVPLKGPADDK